VRLLSVFNSCIATVEWRTRLPAIRTLTQVQLTSAIVHQEPLYQKIAPEVSRLLKLKMSKNAIAKALGVSSKSLNDAIAWMKITNV